MIATPHPAMVTLAGSRGRSTKGMPNPTENVRFRVGADENGLGPRLGPMVVTAVLAEVSPEGALVAARKPRGALAQRLGDSKQLVSHGNVALGEAWARALVQRGAGRLGASPKGAASPDDLIHAISADAQDELRAPCPKHVEAQCWSTAGEAFSAPSDLVDTVSCDLDKLAQKGVRVVAVRSVILCARRMNDGVDAGKNRFVLDLHAMERLVTELSARAGGEVHAVCGKVGGFGKYSAAFGPLGGRLHSVLEEGRARSAYHFPGVGELAFVRDSDASDLCVAMASMVGKYLREALMARVVRFYQALAPELRGASGYHDPVTQRFVEATRLLRTHREVPDQCFERRKLDGKGAAFAEDEGAE
jgi:ribonuclease HII